MMNIVEIGNREFTNLTDIYAYKRDRSYIQYKLLRLG